jgi:hypothetical protein
MAEVPKTRLQPYRPSREQRLEDIAFNAGVVKGEQNIINYLLGEYDDG